VAVSFLLEKHRAWLLQYTWTKEHAQKRRKRMTTAKREKSVGRELRLYFKDVAKFQLLSAAEEKALARRIRKGDRVALQMLILSNLRFALKVARSYRNSGIPLSDLINEGNLGLMEAAKRFDPTRNTRFTSYAIWWIRQAIVKLLYQAGILRHSQRTAN